MKRTLAIMAVLGMSTAIFACNNDKPAANPVKEQASPLWKLSLQSKCAGDVTQCVAGYGFTITADGKYMVGPGPAGQTASGTLKPEELDYINERITALSAPASHPSGDEASATDAATAAPQEVCEALSDSQEESLVLTQQGKAKTLTQSHDNQVCFQTANNEAASELHQAVKDLAAVYYPTPFPNACTDQVNALQGLYASVQSCTADTDCVLVDQSFAAVPPSSDQWVTTNACSSVAPLAIASNKNLVAQHDALTKAYSSALAACGLSADNVGNCDGFMTSTVVPRCQQGVCRVTAAAPAEATPAPAASAAPAPAAPAAAPAPSARR